MTSQIATLNAEIDLKLPTARVGGIAAADVRTLQKDIVANIIASEHRFLLSDYGISDGVTDNAAGFLQFNLDARAVIAAGKRVILDATPNHPTGIWGWSMSSNNVGAFNKWLCGVTKLTIEGNGAKFLNLDGTEAWAIVSVLNYFQDLPNNSYLIDTVSAYSTSVQLNPVVTTPDFQVGDWVMIASLGLQYNGSPMNLDRFDFVRVAGWNKSTGVVSFDRFLEYDHRSDFPDYGTPNFVGYFGKARIYQLKYPGQDLQGGQFVFGSDKAYPWDYDHEYKNMEILASGTTGDLDKIVLNGLRFKATNCVLPGISPSILVNYHTEDCFIRGVNEPDKLVKRFLSVNDNFKNNVPWQSTSVDDVTYINPVAPNGMSIGGKRFRISGGSGYVAGIGRYGRTRSILIENFHNIFNGLTNSGDAFALDGTNFTWSNGSIKISKSVVNDILRGCIPGQQLVMGGPSGKFGGDMAICHVMGLREDASFFYVDTDGPTTLPTWSNNSITPIQRSDITQIACTGGTMANNASKAHQKGLKTCEFYSMRFSNPTWSSGDIQGDHELIGLFKELAFRVTKVGSNVPAGATLTITFNNCYKANDPSFTSQGDMILTIDLNVIGKRTIDRAGKIGFTANDAITLNGSAITVIPTNVTPSGAITWNYSYDPHSDRPDQQSVAQFDVVTDAGILYDEHPNLGGNHSGSPAQFVGGLV